MKRSTWIVVGVVALTLVAASSIPHGAWQRVADDAMLVGRSVAPLGSPATWVDAWRGLQYVFDGFLWQWAGAVAACIALVAGVRALRRARGNAPVRLVQRLARHGGTLATIARRAHLSQDAVRTLLALQSAPAAGGRKILPLGKSLRKNVSVDRAGLVKEMSLAR